ncbi:L-type lectin-domain containing receptor kinase VIII.1 [Ricinus communis]|uniref:L-type lectin-domain containing receptor kinase VIII.1 n=1 Tax=Ricinus communis TaxID=3988 RepID=UPI00201A7DE3|nr:L-type lectin-domain containing receptor kinase VIII.1 [Ricinus communis]
MGSCNFWFLWSSAYLLFLIQLHPTSVESSSADDQKRQSYGPLINVTKHLSFPDFSLDNPRIIHEIQLLGSAKVSKEKGAIQIPDESQATDLKHQAGRAIYSFPIRLLDPLTATPASFETTFSFQFTNSTTSNLSSTYNLTGAGGSGLTFIIVPDEFTVGRPGPWLAMLNDACEDNYKAVAIEFDTRQNPEFGDPNDNHIGIDLGSIVSTITINASDVGISLKDGSLHQAWISYNGPRRWMDIRLASKPIFSGFLDLSPFLNEYMFVGFSASTGNLTQIHNILSWNFTSISQASLLVPSVETCESKITRRTGIVDLQTSQAKSSKKAEPSSSFLIFIAVMVLAIAVVASFFYNGRRRNDQSNLMILADKPQRPRPPNKPRRFTFAEVSIATRCFHELEVLGSDSKGVYYRGKLSNGCQVAVKRFSAQFLNSQLGLDRRQLLKEISTISRVRHPNLVPIRGWCQDNRETMVLYDFYPNGSLDKWLFGVGVLPWTRRFKVVKDVADALNFLHSRHLSHKNMKTSSVFLDVSFRAGLGDFGFVLSPTESRRFEAAVSQKADVFEFGIFVLEVVSGRGRLDNEVRLQEERDLVDFAWRMHETDEKERAVDRRMGAVVNLQQAIRVLEIGLLCTLNEDKGRPSMEEVIAFLSLDRPIPELPSSRPIALFPYNSATGLCTGYSCSPFK